MQDTAQGDPLLVEINKYQRVRALLARVSRMTADDIADVFRQGHVMDNPFLQGAVGEALSHRLRKVLDEEQEQRVAPRTNVPCRSGAATEGIAHQDGMDRSGCSAADPGSSLGVAGVPEQGRSSR